jgi:hypothetical protein
MTTADTGRHDGGAARSGADQPHRVESCRKSIGDYLLLWIILSVATVAMLTLVFVPDLSL